VVGESQIVRTEGEARVVIRTDVGRTDGRGARRKDGTREKERVEIGTRRKITTPQFNSTLTTLERKKTGGEMA
jgi:hypothetical protein